MKQTEFAFEAVEQSRLSKQCYQILELLRQGPATNVQLAGIALKYTSRISDLRKAGYDVRVTSRNRTTGVTVYQLAGEPS